MMKYTIKCWICVSCQSSTFNTESLLKGKTKFVTTSSSVSSLGPKHRGCQGRKWLERILAPKVQGTYCFWSLGPDRCKNPIKITMFIIDRVPTGTRNLLKLLHLLLLFFIGKMNSRRSTFHLDEQKLVGTCIIFRSTKNPLGALN